MNLIVLGLIITIFILSSIFFILLLKYIKISSCTNTVDNDLNKLSIAIKRVRYGDINLRVDNLKNKEIEAAINRLFETIYDREMMIKEYQVSLSQKNMILQEKIEHEKQLRIFKEEFAATLTHDMKVPIIAELNSINYLLDGRFGSLNEKQFELLNLMKKSNLELKELIDSILETYKIEQKEIKLNVSNCNFNKFLLSIIEEMSPIIYESNHKILFDLNNTENIMINIDEFQLKRVIKNLIQNAVSFSPNDSEINIKTFVEENFIKFIISNPGNIVSKEDLDLIFHKYYSGYSKFKKAGTGLGLYISQQIAAAHQGQIAVNNEKEGTTSFILSLPLTN